LFKHVSDWQEFYDTDILLLSIKDIIFPLGSIYANLSSLLRIKMLSIDVSIQSA